ncbi:unnamed protein product [Arabis nemorensis]|uniref:SnoaL-like domain-containing protein n=1 Tax=Arabis nemorensis TaxID=586526 RepID=A0A565CE61_9BRAS|nr:unnamed protein product [Arabis nemorensis]
MPVNGWKAYYAATKTLMNANSEFFEIMAAKSLDRMRRLWLNADHVVCFHESGELTQGTYYLHVVTAFFCFFNFSGFRIMVLERYEAVMRRWEYLFTSWEFLFDLDAFNFWVAPVLTNTVWVTMCTYHHVAIDGPLCIANLFQLHNNRWLLVHHHCSIHPMGGAENIEQVDLH